MLNNLLFAEHTNRQLPPRKRTAGSPENDFFFRNSCSGFMLVFRVSTCIYIYRFIYQFYHPLTSPQTFIQRTFQLPTNSRYLFTFFWLETSLMFLNEKSNEKKIYTFLNISEIFAFSLRVIEGLETSPDQFTPATHVISFARIIYLVTPATCSQVCIK